MCRRFGAKAADEFADLSHGYSPLRAAIDRWCGSVTDCVTRSMFDIGDHHLMVGSVQELCCNEEIHGV